MQSDVCGLKVRTQFCLFDYSLQIAFQQISFHVACFSQIELCSQLAGTCG